MFTVVYYPGPGLTVLVPQTTRSLPRASSFNLKLQGLWAHTTSTTSSISAHEPTDHEFNVPVSGMVCWPPFSRRSILIVHPLPQDKSLKNHIVNWRGRGAHVASDSKFERQWALVPFLIPNWNRKGIFSNTKRERHGFSEVFCDWD